MWVDGWGGGGGGDVGRKGRSVGKLAKSREP